jgi:hypothetical protein
MPYPMAQCSRRIPNQYDWCLYREMARLRSVETPDMCTVPKECRGVLPWDDEWAATPDQAVPFRQVSGITTPATASGDNIVTTLKVPIGYDGIVTGLYWLYSGQGFLQGSGDIIYRLQINRRYVKDLGDIPYSLGSPVLPFPLTEGQLLLSGWSVNVIVTVPNLSGNIQIGASTITAGLIGFFWPRYLVIEST